MIRCIAIDDEPAALDLLQDNIQRIPFLELVQTCEDAFEAMEALEKHEIDLIFMDIQMPGLTGIEFLRSVKPSQLVILVTAYQQFALEGYELNIVDYLLKPTSFERFLQAAQKARSLHELQQQNDVAASTMTIPQQDGHLFINLDYALHRIGFEDILLIESDKDYLKIHLTNAKPPLITRMSLKAMAEKLPQPRFMRVHQSYIVPVDKIEWIQKMRIKIQEHYIPISESYSKAFFQAIKSE